MKVVCLMGLLSLLLLRVVCSSSNEEQFVVEQEIRQCEDITW